MNSYKPLLLYLMVLFVLGGVITGLGTLRIEKSYSKLQSCLATRALTVQEANPVEFEKMTLVINNHIREIHEIRKLVPPQYRSSDIISYLFILTYQMPDFRWTDARANSRSFELGIITDYSLPDILNKTLYVDDVLEPTLIWYVPFKRQRQLVVIAKGDEGLTEFVYR